MGWDVAFWGRCRCCHRHVPPRYLALVSGLASGADWLFIPESPPEDGWEDLMCERLGEVSAGGLSSPVTLLSGEGSCRDLG